MIIEVSVLEKETAEIKSLGNVQKRRKQELNKCEFLHSINLRQPSSGIWPRNYHHFRIYNSTRKKKKWI